MKKLRCFGALQLLILSVVSLSIPGLALAEQEKTVVTITGFGGSDVLVMNHLVKEVLAEDFAELGIEVSYFAVESDYPKYILNSLSSGNAPDAFYVDSTAATAWSQTRKLLPLPDNLVAQRNNVLPILMDVYNKQEKQYAIPKDLNALGLVYNKDIFDDAKVEYPTNNDDWNTFKDKIKRVVEALKDEGVYGLCIAEDYVRFAPFLFSTGWQPFDENYKTTLDNKFKRAFEFYVSLKHDGLAILPADLGQRWGGGCFATERTAVTIEGAWLAVFMADRAPNLLYGTSFIPKDPVTGDHGNLLFTAGWAINADAADLKATEQVVKLLTGDKAQRAILHSGLALPSVTNMSDEPYLQENHSRNQLARTIIASTGAQQLGVAAYGPYGNNWMEPIKEALSAVLTGRLTSDEAIEEAQKQYDGLYERLQP